MGRCCGECSSRGYNFETGSERYCYILRRDVDYYSSCNQFSPKYTESNTDFHGSGSDAGGCYLTSALVEYLGKADDCEELTALRKFRDEYMKKTPEGAKLVEQYYEVAPKIVEAINASDKKESYYEYILGVVNECLALIKEGKEAQTQEKYVEMVSRLKAELL